MAAGHIQDRWWRDKRDENDNVILNAKGKPVREKTDLHGKGLRYKVRWPDPNNPGKELSESFADGKLTRAKNFLATVQTDVLSGVYVDPDAGKITLRSYVAGWLKGQSQDAHTVQTNKRRLNAQIYPFFKEGSLESITVAVARNWLAWMKGNKITEAYRAHIFDLLSAILSAAVEDKLIRSNPLRNKSIKRPKPEVRKIVPWSEVKIKKLHLALPHRYQVVVPLGAGAALRQMEVFGLSPDDIDRDALELHVNRQIRWIDSRPVFAPPKGGKTRVVPLGEGVLDALIDYMDGYEPVRVTLPWLEPTGKPITARLLIDKTNDGIGQFRGPLTNNLWRGGHFLDEVWKPAFKAAGLEYTNRRDGMHALRHFCASNWLAQGSSIKEVSDYLGHHDPGYTLRIYTHLMPSSHKRARLASNKVFQPRRPTAATDEPGTA
ncbi:tyrosine-type recombinase/integrase [Actinocrispum wychmicini]|uniref:Site-specific recombinase XerD n=1 Tax=Actinocrispum wychmicini TaxID=1213861 RepID=A0A4R2IMG4_9PSEU|nr:site-specific integrase [Actinocrispum wychmicini]TCO45937.1 site-specific recombinase XerD [Actinocrispum wychmicini]